MNSYRRAREIAGLTVAQAAKLLGIRERGALERFELWTDRRVDGSCEWAMADLYGCSLAYLTGERCEPPMGAVAALREADVRSDDRDAVLEILESMP